ncbi:MAG: coenzyme F420-0:L-glutamate ligase [Bdellovibrionales bacterium]|nr:coenzyme F420-0:L-glutamate ligase [Bdellovibrionales bacterium]
MKPLKITPITTALFQQGENLGQFIVNSLSDYPIKEESILAVSSKLFSLAEGRVVKTTDKKHLIQQEADEDLGESSHGYHLTIKEGLLLPSAGVDQSNSPTGDYLLFPKNPYLSLKKIWNFLTSHWSLKKFGLLMTDSHTTPLRRGVTGVALAHWGFKAVKDLREKPDLYGRELKVTTVNNVDALASSAVWLMGEGNERRPLALIENAKLEWSSSSSSEEIRIPIEEDLYKNLLKNKINS